MTHLSAPAALLISTVLLLASHAALAIEPDLVVQASMPCEASCVTSFWQDCHWIPRETDWSDTYVDKDGSFNLEQRLLLDPVVKSMGKVLELYAAVDKWDILYLFAPDPRPAPSEVKQVSFMFTLDGTDAIHYYTISQGARLACHLPKGFFHKVMSIEYSSMTKVKPIVRGG
jgi:hypothetical protein